MEKVREYIIMENKKISALGYGFAILSPTVFEKSKQEFKIRSKKILSFFDGNNQIFYKFISKGAFIPLPRIPYDRYELFFNLPEKMNIPEGWNLKNKWGKFNLTIEENCLWVINFKELERWDYKNLVDKKYISGVYYDFDDKEHIDYRAIKYEIPTGKYIVEICGLEKKNFVNDELENYGFLFNLTQIQELIQSIDPSEVNLSSMFE